MSKIISSAFTWRSKDISAKFA